MTAGAATKWAPFERLGEWTVSRKVYEKAGRHTKERRELMLGSGGGIVTFPSETAARDAANRANAA